MPKSVKKCLIIVGYSIGSDVGIYFFLLLTQLISPEKKWKKTEFFVW